MIQGVQVYLQFDILKRLRIRGHMLHLPTCILLVYLMFGTQFTPRTDDLYDLFQQIMI